MIRVGIGGWTYAPWRGSFYPAGLQQARELAFAARAVSAIEINATFYRLQSAKSWAAWRDAVPDGFRFAMKGSRYVTNRKILGEAGEAIGRFLDQGLVELGDRLGPINWQLADTKRFDPDDMAAFLALLPPSHQGVRLRHVIEPRHESFRDPAFASLVRQAGVGVVIADSTDYPHFEVAAGGLRYARLQSCREAEPAGYADAALDQWAARARDWAAGGDDVFLFFIGGDKVRAPAAAQALRTRLDGA
jgi:uncharacterized protein YecE (DUF72 family)